MKTESRYHNAGESFELDRSRKYDQAVTFKPMGLWFGFGDAWIERCQSSTPRWVKPCNYQVMLNGANLLVLKTNADFLTFNKRYKADYYEENGIRVNGLVIMRGIDWPKIAREYDGIEMPIYLWRFRLHPEFMWFYGWDCASGCVWNLSQIELRYVEKTTRAAGRQPGTEASWVKS